MRVRPSPVRSRELHGYSELQRAAAIEVLQAEVRKGLASGRGRSADEVLERLERKYNAMMQPSLKK